MILRKILRAEAIPPLYDAKRDPTQQGVNDGSAGDELRILKERILDLAGNEKVVLFAQPIKRSFLSPGISKDDWRKTDHHHQQTDRDREEQENAESTEDPGFSFRHVQVGRVSIFRLRIV